MTVRKILARKGRRVFTIKSSATLTAAADLLSKRLHDIPFRDDPGDAATLARNNERTDAALRQKISGSRQGCTRFDGEYPSTLAG